MKKLNLLRMVVIVLSTVFLLLACTSTDDGGLDDPEIVTEVEGALADELEDVDSGGPIAEDDTGEDEGEEAFDDDSSDIAESGDDDLGSEEDFGDEIEGVESSDVADNNDAGGGVDDDSDADFGDDEGDDFGDDEDFGDEFAGGDDFDSFGEEETVSESLTQDVAIEEPISLEPALESEPVVPGPIVEAEPIRQSIAVESIDFKSAEGTGTILVRTSAPADISQREYPGKRQLVIDISNSSIKPSLQRPFIMKDFAGTPFAGLNAYAQEGGNAVSMVVQMKQGANLPEIQQEGSSLLIMASGGINPAMAENEIEEEAEEVAAAVEDVMEPEAPAEVTQPEVAVTPPMSGPGFSKGIMSAANFHEFLMSNERYYGKPISIQASQVDIRDLLNFISEESGANIIVSKNVKGEVSLKLREVPWDQALVTIMKSNSLGYVREGNVLRIATLKELEDIAKQIFETQKNIDSLSPRKVKMFSINYADVNFLAGRINPLLTPGKGVSVPDTRTSSIYINDNQRVLDKVTKLIRELDKAPAQVMIEGKIVEAQEKFTQQIGVNWSATGGTSILSNNGGPFGTPTILTPDINVQPGGVPDAAAGVFSLAVGTLKNIGDLSAKLSLSENDNLTKILSSPRIIAMNKEKAEISQESEVLSITSSVSNGVVSRSVERTPVRLRLSVVPQITNNGTVLLDFEVSRAFAGAVEDELTLARAVNNRKAKSKILVKSGETAVIGGIYDTIGVKSETGPVGLKNIPILGWLFKSKVKEDAKNELLIFLTPKILNRG